MSSRSILKGHNYAGSSAESREEASNFFRLTRIMPKVNNLFFFLSPSTNLLKTISFWIMLKVNKTFFWGVFLFFLCLFCLPVIIIIHGFYIALFSALEQTHCVHGLNKIYSFIVIVSSTNKYRKHKSSMLIWVLPASTIC